NYGTPLSELAISPEPHGWAVAEVSSFQLDGVETFRPNIAILLNIQADHLDRHGTMEAYAAAKLRIFARLRPEDDVAIATPEAWEALRALNCADRLPNATGCRLPNDFMLPTSGYFANPVLAPAAEAAAAALAAAGLSPTEITAAFAAFEPLKHRMALVAEKGGVAFIDNSKATSLAALAASLEMAGRPVRLIAGGRLKETDLGAVKKQLEKFAEKVYLIGEASQKLFDAWNGTIPCEKCEVMKTAVLAAARDARAGEAVLLAPGCASFDQFGGYAERGDLFAKCVAEIN
ncbi:MAG: UDP-N-acetylmuramoyl-L-alanine--D-glutamate ligase, partial [Kiritimatiellae bacterium]|nr:UDP-N-acetylmuramoyl-L-alanine--D-glutamate ligase [Kiritimatiellia bacterium]